MNLGSQYGSIALNLHDPVTGALTTISADRSINDARPPLVEMPLLSNTAAIEYSASRTFSLVIAGLRAGAGNTRTRVRVMHQDLPAGVRLRMGEFTGAYVADATTSVDGLSDVAFTGSVQNSAFADYLQSYFLEHDTATGQVGRLRLQFDKVASILQAMDYKTTRGNSGLVTLRFDVPYTIGAFLDGAHERADEAVGTGETRIFLRPLPYDGSGSVNAGGKYSRFYEFGCNAPEIEEEFVREYAQETKGFNREKLAKQMTQNLMNLNLNVKADSEYLGKIVDKHNLALNTTTGIVSGKYAKGGLQKFEAVLEMHTPDGMLHWWRLPSAYVIRNGNVTDGGTEKMIPIQIEGIEPAEHYHSIHLMQSTELAVGLIIP